MNTDQAFELLKSAGIEEEICIQKVRRWLLEGKINYEGSAPGRIGYKPKDTVLALNLLKEAGIDSSFAIQIVKSLLNKDKALHEEKRKRENQYISRNYSSASSLNHSTDQDRMIHQLNIKIKIQDEHIKGIEDLHKSSINTLIQQKDQLKKEIIHLKKEKDFYQKETRKLLKDNIELRKELLKLKEELSKGDQRSPEQNQDETPPVKDQYRQKLGLSNKAGHKEIVAGFKKLLKMTHPDQGGNPEAFHFIKTDFDEFRKNGKGN